MVLLRALSNYLHEMSKERIKHVILDMFCLFPRCITKRTDVLQQRHKMRVKKRKESARKTRSGTQLGSPVQQNVQYTYNFQHSTQEFMIHHWLHVEIDIGACTLPVC
jgi:hypothetical protein